MVRCCALRREGRGHQANEDGEWLCNVIRYKLYDRAKSARKAFQDLGGVPWWAA